MTPRNDQFDLPKPGLLVQQGPLAGSHFSLRPPVTLLGDSAACDIRLSGKTILPLHCLLTPTPNEVLVRSIGQGVVLVNGQPILSAELQDGDVLQIGANSMRVCLTPDQRHTLAFPRLVSEPAKAVEDSNLALRLESQQKHLQGLRQQIDAAESNLHRQEFDFIERNGNYEQQLNKARKELDAARKALAQRETRLMRIWSKFKSRIERQQDHLRWAEERLIKQSDRDQKQIDRQRSAINRKQLHVNTQGEIKKRQIAESWQQFYQSEAKLREQFAALTKKERELARKEKEFLSIEAHRSQVEQVDLARREQLRQEIELLEARADAARSANDYIAAQTAAATVQLIKPASQCERDFTRVANAIADEQAILADQVDRFMRARQEWAAEQSLVAAELQAAAAELAEREANLAKELEGLANREQRVEADRARVHAEATSCKAELDRLGEQLSIRTREVQEREETLEELYQRWGSRRSASLQSLQQSREANEAAREEWASHQASWLRAELRLTVAQQEVAALHAAVEQHRQECLDASPDPKIAAKRIERLQRRWQSRFALAARDLTRLGALMQGNFVKWDRRATELHREEMRLLNRSNDLDDLFAIAEIQQFSIERERAEHAGQVKLNSSMRESYEKQLADIRDQLDRVASMFVETPSESAYKAA